MRDDRVPKTIEIHTNRNPDDPKDAKEAAEEARRQGILVSTGHNVSSFEAKLPRTKSLHVKSSVKFAFLYHFNHPPTISHKT